MAKKKKKQTRGLASLELVGNKICVRDLFTGKKACMSTAAFKKRLKDIAKAAGIVGVPKSTRRELEKAMTWICKNK